MDTFSGLEVREIPLSLAFARRKRDDLLRSCGLEPGEADYALGVYDSEERLLGTASLDGDTIKGVCLAPELRDSAVTGSLVTGLLAHANARGISNVRVFTKPEYEPVFRSLSFSLVGQGAGAVLLESDAGALKKLKSAYSAHKVSGRSGAIVMNVNPLTRGHLYLIESAAEQVDHLFIIPVGDNPRTMFTLAERAAALKRATTGMENVTVLESSPYCISAATFPTYFIKEVTDQTRAHCTLDLDIFARHIAPSLGVTVRFAGTEPKDELTRTYNAAMKELLPARGIEVVEIERLKDNGEWISASNVRKLIGKRHIAEALSLVPVASAPMILSKVAEQALLDEVNLTPKPGLVDRDNSGAHTDMDYALMCRSAETLRPW